MLYQNWQIVTYVNYKKLNLNIMTNVLKSIVKYEFIDLDEKISIFFFL
jgi:hypothetical protein